jgi:hypothetical protein
MRRETRRVGQTFTLAAPTDRGNLPARVTDARIYEGQGGVGTGVRTWG